MTQPQTASADASPRSTTATIGMVGLRFVTAGWIGYGVVAKAIDFNPQLLPPPILKTLLWFASNTSLDANTFIEWSYRAILGAEIFIVLTLLFSARWARPIAMATLGFFCVILLESMRQTAAKDGLAKALTGSCGCFGEKGLPASVMLLVDAALLANAVFLAPRVRTGGAAPLLGFLAAGAIAAVAIPAPTMTAEPAPDGTKPTPPALVEPTPAQPRGTGPIVEPWPEAPARYDSFYFPKWKEWPGTRFRDQKIALAIDRPVPADLEAGDWLVVFSRWNCETCQEMYRAHFATARTEKVLKVVIADNQDKPLPMPCIGCKEVLLHRARSGEGVKSPDYLVQTPVIVRLKDGIVISVCSDFADKDSLRTVLGEAAATAAPAPAPRVTPAWPAAPTTLKPFYVAEFAGTEGKPLADNEFARLIAGGVPSAYLSGRALLIFYREDCEHCHELLEAYFTRELPAQTLTIAIPDTDPANAMPNPCDRCGKGTMLKGPNYVIGTPVVIGLKDGVVDCVIENVDDVAALEACLNRKD
ncbi:MAG: hypothetical protein ACKO0W_13745 [Planctomycetota bacterium]